MIIKVGTIVKTHCPKDPEYHGLVGKVVEIRGGEEPNRSLRVQLCHKSFEDVTTPYDESELKAYPISITILRK